MTELPRERIKNILSFLFLSAMFFILLHAEECRKDLQDGLRLCAENVIPSLFPHLVLSELFVSNLSFSKKDTLFSRFFFRLFRLPSASSSIMLVGMICGFPIGARLASKFYREGILDQREAELLCAYANNTGPAFVISGVGVALFGSLKIGILFFFSEIAAAFFCLFFSSFFRSKKEKRSAPLSCPCMPSVSFVETVRIGSVAMLNICGFILFFSLLSGMFCRIFSRFSLLFSAILEVTSACKNASFIAPFAREKACYFAVFSIGFGGLSAGLQSALSMKESNLRFRFYLPRKLIQGILSLFFFLLLTEAVGI